MFLTLKTEEDLLDLLEVADPGAATPLYDRFASGIRVLMRHRLPGVDTEMGVFHVLVTAARAVRQGQAPDAAALVTEVRAATHAFIAEARGKSQPYSRERVRELRRKLGRLTRLEKEILRRIYGLTQDAAEISRDLKIPQAVVSEVRTKARQRFFAENLR